jgi:hypothetical protein
LLLAKRVRPYEKNGPCQFRYESAERQSYFMLLAKRWPATKQQGKEK